MAARTTTGDGVVSNTVGTNLDGGTPLGTTDTLTVSHNITIDEDTELGSSPNTGGTPAIQFSNAVTGKTVTVSSGATLTCKGDFKFNASDFGPSTLQINGTFKFLPASGQRYDFACTQNSDINCGGSSGARAVVMTDLSSGGDPARMPVSSYRRQGLRTCTYTDFIDMGDASNFAPQTQVSAAAADFDQDVSITNCTFTRCNYKFRMDSASWDKNFTFQNNSFASSVSITEGGIADCCASFVFSGAGTAGTWLIDTNGFDKIVFFGNYRARTQFSNNVFQLAYISAGGWSDAAKFSGNIITGCQDQPLFGPIQNCYAYTSVTNNPHWMGFSVGSVNVTDCVFDPPEGVVANGDILQCATAAGGTCAITGNLVLSQSNNAAGVLVNGGLGMTSGALTVNHNTMLGLSESGLVCLGETSSDFAGQLAECRSNLVYASPAGAACLIVNDLDASPAADAVVVASHNATRNASTGTCKYNTNTSQANVVGYSGIVTAENNDYPNACAGTNDITISADPFVDSTRNIAKWAAFKGQAETAAAAIAYAVANPAAATDATTGLRAWVRAGFKVTDDTLQDAGHDGETIGAGEFQAASGGGSIAATLIAIGVI